MSLSQTPKRTWAQVALQNIENARPNFTALCMDSLPPLPSKPKATTSLNVESNSNVEIEEMDPNNTRIFVRLVSNGGGFSASELFSCFRLFGPIRSISFNTKRYNGIVDFATKEGALNAKSNFSGTLCISNRLIPAKLYWGKRIDRALPPRHSAPSLSQQIMQIREVHLAASKQASSATISQCSYEVLGLPRSPATMEPWEYIYPDWNFGNLGRYPLRLMDSWFTCAQGRPTRGLLLGDLLEASIRRNCPVTFQALLEAGDATTPELISEGSIPSANSPICSTELSDSEFMSAASALSSCSHTPTASCSPADSLGPLVDGTLPSFEFSPN